MMSITGRSMRPTRKLSRRRFGGLVGAGIAVALGGCDEETGPSNTDAGPGGSNIDAGPSGPSNTDAGAPDGGPNNTDAGAPDGGPNNTDAGPGSTACATSSALIGGNHGHSLTLTMNDISAGQTKVYDIRGISGHTHTVTLTPSDFATLAGGNPVMVVSSNDAGHTHNVNVSCT